MKPSLSETEPGEGLEESVLRAADLIASEGLWGSDGTTERGRRWVSAVFVPVTEEGFFVPPLFACDVFQSTWRLSRGVDPQVARKREDWRDLVDFLRRLRGCGFSGNKRDLVVWSRDVLREVGAGVLARYNLTGFLSDEGRFDPYEIIRMEADILAGKGNQHQARFDEIRAFIRESYWSPDPVAAPAEPSRMISTGRQSLVAVRSLTRDGGRVGGFDPFVAGLLKPKASLEKTMPNEIVGQYYRSQEPRMVRGPVGQFASREPGPLSDSLERLEPTELLLLDTFPKYALWRAENGGLVQSYYRRKVPGKTAPTVKLFVELQDDGSRAAFRSQDGDCPVISWYRAVIAELVHRFVLLMRAWKWEGFCELLYSDPLLGRSGQSPDLCANLLPVGMEMAAESPSDALSALMQTLPVMFANLPAPAPKRDSESDEDSFPLNFLWRVVLGTEVIGRTRFDVVADHRLGVRLHCLPDGICGVECHQTVERIHEEPVHGFLPKRIPPFDAANTVLSQFLPSNSDDQP